MDEITKNSEETQVEKASMEEKLDGSKARRKTRQRGFTLPLLLIGLGVILLLNTLNVLDVSVFQVITRFWPVLLILIGLDVLIGRRSMIGNLVMGVVVVAAVVGIGLFAAFAPSSISIDMGDGASQHFSNPLDGAQEIDAHIDFGAGEFDLAALPGSSQDAVLADFNSNFGSGLQFEYQPGSSATVTIEEENGGISFPGFNRSIERKLVVNLASGVPIILDVNAGAGDIYLDLSGLEIEDFRADIGAGDVTIQLPEEGQFEVDISMGAGSLTLIIPDGLQVRLTRDVGIGDFEINDSRFVRDGNVFMTRDFDESEDYVEINLDMGVGELNIR